MITFAGRVLLLLGVVLILLGALTTAGTLWPGVWLTLAGIVLLLIAAP